jgi:hypothetical protein
LHLTPRLYGTARRSLFNGGAPSAPDTANMPSTQSRIQTSVDTFPLDRRHPLEAAIAELQSRRAALGVAPVDAALAPLLERSGPGRNSPVRPRR